MSSTASTNSEEVKVLVSMGFPEQQAKIALLRANNEVNRAVELLSAGLPQEDDAEFDLIAAAGPVPDISPATVFYARSDHQGEKDPFVAVTHGSVSEFIDSRISTFTEMGFSSEEAVSALRSCHDDVNEALSMLLHQNDV